MDEVIAIHAQLIDEASQPLKDVTALTDRLCSSLSSMHKQLSAMYSLEGDTPEPSGSSGAKAQGGASGESDASAQATRALSELSQAALNAGTTVNSSAQGVSGTLDRTGTMLSALNTSAGALSGALSTLRAYQASAASAAQSAASGLRLSASAATSAQRQLQALSGAASSLSTRLGSVGNVQKHAEGGILSTPHMGLVAEDGPEAIIPLNGKRRTRSIDLWQRAGQALGVRAYAQGGMPDMPAPAAYGAVNMGGVNVNISLESRDTPLSDISSGSSKIADEVARAIAEGLERALRNMA